MIFCEANLQGWSRSEYVIQMLQEIEGAQLADVVEAVRSQDSLERCRQFLKRECECLVCYSMYPLTQVTTSRMVSFAKENVASQKTSAAFLLGSFCFVHLRNDL
jgi:hypothetical protein